MTARLVDGRALRTALEERVARTVERLSQEGPVRLTAVSVGSAGASDVYLRNQSRACHCLRRRRAACGLRNTIRGWWRRRAHFHALVAPVLPPELGSRACAAPTAPPTPSAR